MILGTIVQYIGHDLQPRAAIVTAIHRTGSGESQDNRAVSLAIFGIPNQDINLVWQADQVPRSVEDGPVAAHTWRE